MPIYEFKCSECGEFFEVLVMGSTDESLKGCPKCGADTFERVISRFSHAMGQSPSGAGAGVHTQERSCSGGSCKTYTIPGESR